MPRTLFSSIAFLAIALLSTPQPSRAEIDATLLSNDFSIAEIDALIAENVADLRLVFDLLSRKAEALKAEGDLAGAAATTLEMATVSQVAGPQVEADLPMLYWDAGDLFAEAGDDFSALDSYNLALEALRTRAPEPPLLAALLRRIADLEEAAGRTDLAAALRAEADDPPVAQTEEPHGTRGTNAGFQKVQVFYATDRARSGDPRPARYYNADRGAALDYGIVEVTIPGDHKTGTIAAPSIWKLQFYENPTKHVMLQSVTPMAQDAYFGAMQAELAKTGADDLFVFVHGYNVSFDAAAKRTAQLAFDMKFAGVPVLYSWPSAGATVGYVSDTAVVRLSGRRLSRFLEDLVARSGARTIHLIGHSMGNRALTDALELMALRQAPVERAIFDQIIFAAPDVDQGLFSVMLEAIRPMAKRLTLYASEQDWALVASRKLHGNMPRAGQGGPDAMSHAAIDTIDMSDLGEDMLAHSYVANDRSAILDIATLFWRSPDPAQRCGLAPREGLARVWEYRGSTCTDQNLLNVIGHLKQAGAQTRADVQATLRREFFDAPEIAAFEDILLNAVGD